MKKLLLGLATIAAIATPVVGIAGSANADVSNNGTTKDAYGYCVANYNHTNGEPSLGSVRSTQTGKQVSGDAGNRAPAICVWSQGLLDPISNNG